MNQVFDKQLIFDRIKDSGFPFWGLYLSNGFNNRTNIMQYWGSDFADDDTDDTKLQKSIARLDNIVKSFPADSVFIIEIRNSKQANGNGVIGPLQFANEVKQEPNKQTEGLATVPTGYVPAEMLDGVEKRMASEFEARLNAYKAEMAEQKREEELQRKSDELAVKEKELKDLEKGYNSSVAKSADVVVKILERLGELFLPNIFGNAPDASGIPAMAQQQLGTAQPQQNAEPDPKADAVNNICDYLYDNRTAEELNDMYYRLKQEKNGNLGTETTSDTATTATYI